MTTTHHSAFAGFVALLLCTAAFAPAGEARRVAEILPEGTIFVAHVVTWEQWAKDFRETAPAQILNDPEVKAFLEGPLNRLAAPLKRAEQPQPGAGKAAAAAAPGMAGELLAGVKTFFDTVGSWMQSLRDIKLEKPLADMVDAMGRGPYTLAVRYSAADARDNKAPALIAIVGRGYPNDTEAQLQSLGEYLKKAEFKVTLFKTELATVRINVDAVDSKKERGVQFVSLAPIQDGKRKNLLTLAFANDRLLVSNDEELCKSVIDGMAGVLDKRLSDTEPYKSCGLGGDEHLLAYLDIPNLQKALGSPQEAARDAATPLDRFLTQAGLNQATAVAWSLKMNGLAFESRTAIFTKGEREGWLGKLADGELDPEVLRICPAGAPFATAFRLKPDGVQRPLLREVFWYLQGDKGVASFDAAEKEILDAGRNLEKELGAAFGSDVVITSLAAQADTGPIGPVSAFAASVSVKDKDRADKVLDDLLGRLAAKADPAGGGLKRVEGSTIRYYTTPAIGGLVSVSPSFATQDNRLVIAVDVPTLWIALRTMQKGPWLTNSEPFKSSLASAGGKMGAFLSYVDWACAYKAVYNNRRSMGAGTLGIIATNAILDRVGIDLNPMPSADAVASNLCPGLSVARVTGNSVFLASRSPLPSVAALTAITAVFASFRPTMAAEKK